MELQKKLRRTKRVEELVVRYLIERAPELVEQVLVEKDIAEEIGRLYQPNNGQLTGKVR